MSIHTPGPPRSSVFHIINSSPPYGMKPWTLQHLWMYFHLCAVCTLQSNSVSHMISQAVCTGCMTSRQCALKTQNVRQFFITKLTAYVLFVNHRVIKKNWNLPQKKYCLQWCQIKNPQPFWKYNTSVCYVFKKTVFLVIFIELVYR